jgi:hypothetical protein
MCGLCGVLMTSHWTDSGSGRRARVFRTALLNRVLDHFGLRLDDWSGSVYVLRDRKGRAEVVADLGALWQTAERMLGRRLDPLDPALLQALAADRG